MPRSSVRGSVAVVLLTYNEELNLPHALASVTGWADEVFVLDSLSTDATVRIAKDTGAIVVEHAFEDYAKQRNFALDRLPITSEWILFLDADEWLPDQIKQEISRVIESDPVQNGFFLNRRFIWMGAWIRRGYYPSWILRLFRRGKGRCEDRAVNEHMIVEGATGHIASDFIHEDRKGVDAWIAKHNGYATREALELLREPLATDRHAVEPRLFGPQAARKRWLRERIWNRMPPLVRPFFFFVYRYILRGGFLDGKAGFTFHFLQALWYPLLIDIKYLEFRKQLPDTHATHASVLESEIAKRQA